MAETRHGRHAKSALSASARVPSVAIADNSVDRHSVVVLIRCCRAIETLSEMATKEPQRLLSRLYARVLTQLCCFQWGSLRKHSSFTRKNDAG